MDTDLSPIKEQRFRHIEVLNDATMQVDWRGYSRYYDLEEE